MKSITIRDHNGRVLVKLKEKDGRVDYTRHYMCGGFSINIVMNDNSRMRFPE